MSEFTAPSAKRVWITGASGFVGHRLCLEAVQRGWSVLASSRAVAEQQSLAGIEWVGHQQAIAGEGLERLDVVIHVAARAHQLRETAADPAAAFRTANVDVSLAVARAAKQAGAARLVYVSSIGVNGDATQGRAFCESDIPHPAEPYAVSKLEAEIALREHCAASGMQLAIVRPPLVYGVGAPGNFARLLKLARSGLPLPLAAVDNRRSFVAVQNLCDFLLCLAEHPAAAGELFLVSDGEDFSTPQLLRLLAQAAGSPSRLWPLPPSFLRAGAALIGQQRTFDKLCGSLQVDASKARQLLGWTPPISAAEGLAAWAEKVTKGAGG
ncbi:MAG: NAD-dependent epimerase/dehydratase family protein [Pseudomonadota bacterium]